MIYLETLEGGLISLYIQMMVLFEEAEEMLSLFKLTSNDFSFCGGMGRQMGL